MRVLLTSDAVGGVLTYAAELSRALARRGVRVSLAVEGVPPSRDQLAAFEGVRGLSLRVHPCRLEWMDDPWNDVAEAGRWLLDLEVSERPDLVHLNSFSHGALPFRAPKLVVAHSCVVSWWEAVRGGSPPPAWDRYRAAVRAGLAGADAVAAPSRAMADALERHHGPLCAPARVVPNGRDPRRFAPAREKEELVLASGRLWDEAKNAAALVRVAERVSWPIVIAGETTPPSPSPSPASTSTPTSTATSSPTPYPVPTAGRATLLGRVPERALARWLSRAGIYAHPARYEPFGLGVLEAALAGCALVLGDIPSLRENWDGAAAFAPPDDDGAVAAAIDALCRDGLRRRALAARARSRALDLGPARMAAGYLGLYQHLVARDRRAP